MPRLLGYREWKEYELSLAERESARCHAIRLAGTSTASRLRHRLRRHVPPLAAMLGVAAYFDSTPVSLAAALFVVPLMCLWWWMTTGATRDLARCLDAAPQLPAARLLPGDRR